MIILFMMSYCLTVALLLTRQTRLSFEVFSLESPWTMDYVFAPLPSLRIGFSVAVREGGGGSFFSLREAYILSFSLLLCLEPFKKISVGGGWWWWVVGGG